MTRFDDDAARAAITSGEVTATALAELHYGRIAAQDGKINSFLALSRERAMAQAAKIDGMAAKGGTLPCWLAFRLASRMCW